MDPSRSCKSGLAQAPIVTPLTRFRWYTNTMTSDRIRSKDTFLSQNVDLVSADLAVARAPCVLAPGNFVWPFEFDLGSCQFESVNGLGDTFVEYEIRATVVTARQFAKNHCAVKEIKVMRTPCLNEINATEPDQVDLLNTVHIYAH